MDIRVALHLSLFLLSLVTQTTNGMNEEKNKIVCDQWCRNATCEITDSGLMCSEGCIAGFTGYRCKEHCPERCKECHQVTGECISCVDGVNGDNCTSTSSPSTSTTFPSSSISQCAEMCDVCTGVDPPCQVCLNGTTCQDVCGCNSTLHSTTSVSTYATTDSYSDTTTPRLPGNDSEPEYFWNKITGLGTFGLLLLAAVVICYKCRHQCQLKCTDFNRVPLTSNTDTSQKSDGSSPPNTGYVYIDDDNLEACHSRPQPDDALPPRCPNDNSYEKVGNRRSPPRCPNGNYYESIGNRRSTSTDTGSESSLSTWSGTLFGNLFEINGGVADRELNQDIEIVSLEDYEMRTRNYLTPNLSINSNQGTSLV